MLPVAAVLPPDAVCLLEKILLLAVRQIFSREKQRIQALLEWRLRRFAADPVIVAVEEARITVFSKKDQRIRDLLAPLLVERIKRLTLLRSE